MFNNFTFVAAAFFSILTASCSNETTTVLTDKSASIYCPAGSEELTLDLTNVSLTREKNIPIMYQGYNNIEGPVWHDGALYYSNMGSHQPDENGFELSNQTTIWRWVVGEEPQIWMEDTVAGTNGC